MVDGLNYIYLGDSILTEKGYVRTIQIPSHLRYIDGIIYNERNGIKLYVWNDYNFD